MESVALIALRKHSQKPAKVNDWFFRGRASSPNVTHFIDFAKSQHLSTVGLISRNAFESVLLRNELENADLQVIYQPEGVSRR